MKVNTTVASSEDFAASVGTVEISLDLLCTVKQDARGSRWVAGCPALDLFSQGRTEEEAKLCLKEATGIWVEDCLERGTLDQALREVSFHSRQEEEQEERDERRGKPGVSSH